MSELHDALKELGAIDWSDVPQDNLKPFLTHIFEAGELICNSVPPPPGGDDFSDSKPSLPSPDTAKSSNDIVASEARSPPPHPEHAGLQKSWGKPMKLGQKDNPLGISVYKMAGKDRHGAWFARRSVHEGVSFTRLYKSMQREFAESLAVQGGPGEGNIRGIGADQKLEKKEVEGAGCVEAYQLSAQFPGPTTPREFITLVSTSQNALSDKTNQGKGKIPRHHMVVSKPLTHPDAPDREGYVKGYYESVEMIREIPLNPVPENESESKDGKHELNPVEWIMITRSDPGGGIPRFMVERGTPASICGDVVKFFDWACSKDTDQIKDPDADEDLQKKVAEQKATAPPPQAKPKQPAPQQQEGVLSSFTNVLEAGIEAYAPASVATYAQGYLHQDDDTSSVSSSDSSASFASAQDHRPATDTPVVAAASTDTLGATSSAASVPVDASSPHEKELRKIEQNKEKVVAKIAKKRASEDDKFQHADTTDPKTQEKHDKEVLKLEQKREKELQKLEHKREKEMQKAQKKREKNLNSETMGRISRERDDFRNQMDSFKRENVLLREQMADLQRENAILVQKVHGLGGEGAVREIQKEVNGH